MGYYLLTRITRPGLPKKRQTFLFFRILKPDQFKLRLKDFVPEITTAALAVDWKKTKEEERNLPYAKQRAYTGVNIAFASTGLEAVSSDTN